MQLIILGTKVASSIKKVIEPNMDNVKIVIFTSLDEFADATELRNIDCDRLIFTEEVINGKSDADKKQQLQALRAFLDGKYMDIITIGILRSPNLLSICSDVFCEDNCINILFENKVKPSMLIALGNGSVSDIQKIFKTNTIVGIKEQEEEDRQERKKELQSDPVFGVSQDFKKASEPKKPVEKSHGIFANPFAKKKKKVEENTEPSIDANAFMSDFSEEGQNSAEQSETIKPAVKRRKPGGFGKKAKKEDVESEQVFNTTDEDDVGEDLGEDLEEFESGNDSSRDDLDDFDDFSDASDIEGSSLMQNEEIDDEEDEDYNNLDNINKKRKKKGIEKYLSDDDDDFGEMNNEDDDFEEASDVVDNFEFDMEKDSIYDSFDDVEDINAQNVEDEKSNEDNEEVKVSVPKKQKSRVMHKPVLTTAPNIDEEESSDDTEDLDIDISLDDEFESLGTESTTSSNSEFDDIDYSDDVSTEDVKVSSFKKKGKSRVEVVKDEDDVDYSDMDFDVNMDELSDLDDTSSNTKHRPIATDTYIEPEDTVEDESLEMESDFEVEERPRKSKGNNSSSKKTTSAIVRRDRGENLRSSKVDNTDVDFDLETMEGYEEATRHAGKESEREIIKNVSREVKVNQRVNVVKNGNNANRGSGNRVISNQNTGNTTNIQAGNGASKYSNIIKGIMHETIVVTGERRSGVTQTALTFAKMLSRSTPTLYVDLDIQRHGSLYYLGIDDLVDCDQAIQNGLGLVKNGKDIRKYVFHSSVTGFDALVSMPGHAIREKDLQESLSQLAFQVKLYNALVIDCPFENLYLLEELMFNADFFFCVDSDICACSNMLFALDNLNAEKNPQKGLSLKTLTMLNAHAKYIVKVTEQSNELITNMNYLEQIYGLYDDSINWSRLACAGTMDNLEYILQNI